ncbi:hypothetical protein M0802_014818 [Mischocyttarus mexicanus]|nr:hypothetical protein M0802_014820 [Mischocyttarus mexicanus]KAI4476781.1 hypothetical protein M0802_014818 [Mischocyttarus mexicanus]
MEVTKRLKGERAHLKARLTHLERLIEQEKLDINEMRSRHGRLKEQLKDYELSSVKGLNNGANENEFTDFDELADRYYAIGKRINGIAGASISTPSPNPSKATVETPRAIALPHIDLPHFDGDLESWPAYKENFVSLLDVRTDLSEVDKFSYLRGSLRGSARKAFNSYRPTAANYKIAWNALLETYDRLRLLIAHAIDAILDLEMPRDNDRAGLEGLMHDARARVNHLTSLGLTQLTVLTHLYARLTPRQHQAEWRKRAGSDAYPSIEDLFTFWTDKLVELPLTTKSSVRKDRGRDHPGANGSREMPVADSNDIVGTASAKAWARDNGKAMFLMISTMEDEQYETVQTSESARAMWDKLALLNEQRSVVNQNMMLEEYHGYRMGANDSAIQHVSRVLNMAGRLRDIGAEMDGASVVSKIVAGLTLNYTMFRKAWASVPAERQTIEHP